MEKLKAWIKMYEFKLGLMSLVLGVFMLVSWSLPKYWQLQEQQQELEKQQQQINKLETFKSNVVEFEKRWNRLKDQEQKLGQIIREGVDTSEIGALLQQKAERAQVRLQQISIKEIKSNHKVLGLKRHCLELRLSGEYGKLLSFIKEMEEEKLLLENFRLTGKERSRELYLECRINIYVLGGSNT